MDNPKVESKTYTKVVPLKGSLRQLLKNEFRKDKAKTNDTATGANSAVATVSNAKPLATVPPAENSMKSSEIKIIIQKVENVRIETISTTPQGPLRRVSSFFNPGKSSQAENSYKATTLPASKEDDAMSEGIFKIPNASELNGAQEPNAPIRLFSTKMPENSRNQKIPLKMTRTIKLPFKPKQIMRPRMHRVETIKSVTVPVKSAVVTAPEVAFSIYVHDIEMSDVQEQAEAPAVSSSQNLRNSPLEENFKGFESDGLEENMWMKMMRTTRNEGSESVPETLMQTVNNGEPSSSASVKPPTAPQVLKSVKPSSPKKQPKADQDMPMLFQFAVNVKDGKTEIPSKVPKAPRSPQVKHPRIKALKLAESPPAQLISVNRAIPPQVPVKQVEYPQVISPSAGHTPFRYEIVKGVGDTKIILKPITANVETIAAETPSVSKPIEARLIPSTSQPFESIAAPSTSKSFAPSTSKGMSASKKKKQSSSWKEDILVVIGKPRLAEIDKDLKKIPNLVTGSAIESENVEFKLIIKHLLRLLKVNSVIEALTFTLPDDDPFDDNNDDFPDSFDDDSQGPGNYSTGDSMDSSFFGDDNDIFNCDNASPPDPSYFDSPAAEREMTDSTANETLALDIPVQMMQFQESEIESEMPDLRSEIIEQAVVVLPTEATEALPIERAPSPQTISEKNVEKVSARGARKRKKEPTPPKASEPPKVRATAVRKPWGLLLDGERRKQSLRGSSCDSTSEASTSIKECPPKKKFPRIEELKEAAIGTEPSSSNELCVVMNKINLTEHSVESEAIKTSKSSERLNSLRSSSCESSTKNSPASPPRKKFARAKKLKIAKVDSGALVAKADAIVTDTQPASSKPQMREKRLKSLRSSSAESKPDEDFTTSKKLRRVQKLQGSESDSGPSKRVSRQNSVVHLNSSADRRNSLRSSSAESQANESIKPSKMMGRVKELQMKTTARENSLEPMLIDLGNPEPAELDRKSRKSSSRESSTAPLAIARKKQASKSHSQKQSDSDSPLSIVRRRLKTVPLRPSSGDDNEVQEQPKKRRGRPPKNSSAKKPVKNLRKQKGSTELTSVMEKLSATIASRKSSDPTFVTPATIEKRDRLRTSAFKGNKECSSDEDIQSYSKPDTREPSVSRGSCHEPDSQPANNRRGRKAAARNNSATKKVFVQEPLENAIEAQVPYRQIVEAIGKAPSRGQGRGRTSLKAKHEYEIEMEKNLKELKALKFFRCGSCQFKVSKHLWVDHFLSHGGLAWIDGFEPPIDIQDWNECLRRTLNNYKSYQQTVFNCQHCNNEMRSAMGHLSHVFTCCESKETIEKRKIQCESCDEKYFPFTASFHRNKCSGRVKVYAADDGDDEDEEKSSNSDEIVTAESFNSCGRTKRKAVQKAEKKFKKILESKKPLENLIIVGGNLKCRICGDTGFDSQVDAVEHIRATHELSESEDEASSGSAGVIGGESDSTEETEGSTDNESSHADSPMEEDPNDSNEPTETFSFHKAKASSKESQEMKNGRAMTTQYVETLRGKNISKMATHWTKKFSDENWKTEMFPEIIPKYNLTLSQDAKDFLSKIRFNMKSVKFGSQLIEHYAEHYESPYGKGWKQLEIGESDDNKDSSTIFCGGSVSSIDWAPASGDLNFLAVACNITSQGVNINLTETAKSCVQVYEFKNLVNEKFQGFGDTSKLCYVIIINDGPIWSIKFHPSASSIDKRIGLLAVATANQNVLVYSLPYLNNAKSIVLPLKPSLVCQLEAEDNFFNDEFLLQATRVAWFQKSACDSVLAAGYVSGLVGVWNISRHEYSDEEASNTLYPHHVIQAHLEPITALDFRTKTGSEFQLLSASLDRRLKVYTFDEVHYCEISNYYSPSRVLCAEWWMHWPGYLMGNDDCFTYSSFNYRQPLEFGIRNCSLLAMTSSITDISINNWLNMAMFVTDAGDVIGCQPDQLMQLNVKDKWKWSYFKHQMYSSTDFNKVSDSEINVVFGDFKSQQGKSVPPKKFRPPPTERINELQINHVCFNRTEESYRFYALGYETGFIRIRYLKNSK